MAACGHGGMWTCGHGGMWACVQGGMWACGPPNDPCTFAPPPRPFDPQDAPGASLPCRPSLFFGGCLCLGFVVLATAYPSELHRNEGRNFLLPAACICAVSSAAESRRSFFEYGVASQVHAWRMRAGVHATY